jgi:NitT/TauT family transport system substrate-binding protein
MVQPALTQETKVTQLKVGYIPVGIYGYLWRARDAGYFQEENLEVELVPMAGGGQIIPALQSGALQFGISDALGVLNARNGGIPVTYVSFNFQQTAESPVHAVLTMDPAIQSAADLAGKSVATNLSYNTDWTMMREWLRKQGVDINSVTFREIPSPICFQLCAITRSRQWVPLSLSSLLARRTVRGSSATTSRMLNRPTSFRRSRDTSLS